MIDYILLLGMMKIVMVKILAILEWLKQESGSNLISMILKT